jgi:hypothetical protein
MPSERYSRPCAGLSRGAPASSRSGSSDHSHGGISDADLLVIVDQDDRQSLDRLPEFMGLLEGLRRPVDLIVLTAAEWRARKESRFHREITSRGLQLHPGSPATPPGASE